MYFFLCVCTIWQFLLLLRSLKIIQMTVYNCVTVFFVWLYGYIGWGAFLDTIGRHFLITTALLYLSIGPAIYMKQLGSERGVSRSHICHSPVLWAVAYTAYSCGSMWNQNWAPPVNCALAEDPGVYLGKKYISCWNNRFLKVQIYIYIYRGREGIVK